MHSTLTPEFRKVRGEVVPSRAKKSRGIRLHIHEVKSTAPSVVIDVPKAAINGTPPVLAFGVVLFGFQRALVF